MPEGENKPLATWMDPITEARIRLMPNGNLQQQLESGSPYKFLVTFKGDSLAMANRYIAQHFPQWIRWK